MLEARGGKHEIEGVGGIIEIRGVHDPDLLRFEGERLEPERALKGFEELPVEQKLKALKTNYQPFVCP